MDYFLGENRYDGIIIAAAAKISYDFGIPSFSPKRLERLAEQIRVAPECPEIDQVILVCERLPAEILQSEIPGLEIIGLAIANDLSPEAKLGLPAVVDLGSEFFDEVSEFDILILDGNRGRVYINPNAITLARYQEQTRKARRYFLEGVHVPARMASTNKVIQALAITDTELAIEEAIQNGADGIYVPAKNTIFGSSEVYQGTDEQIAKFAQIINTIGGLPIFLDVPLMNLAVTALARAAGKAPIHLVIEDPAEIEEFQTQMQAVTAYLQESEIGFGKVLIERAFSEATLSVPMPDDMCELSGMVVRNDLLHLAFADLLIILGLAQHGEKPATVILDIPEAHSNENWKQILTDPLSFGFSRVAVPPSAVVEVKDAIREL